MYEALKNMFESNNTLKALTLKGQLQNIKMNHCQGTIASKYQSGRAELPNFDRLWTDCTQEEIKLIARGVQDFPHDDNHALSFHTKKDNKRMNRRSFVMSPTS
jgi:hypothetical protein